MKQKNTAAKWVRQYPSQEVWLCLEMPLGLPCWDIWRKSCWVPALPGMITQTLPLYPHIFVLPLKIFRQKIGKAQSSRAEVNSLSTCCGAVTKLQKQIFWVLFLWLSLKIVLQTGINLNFQVPPSLKLCLEGLQAASLAWSRPNAFLQTENRLQFNAWCI